MQRRLIDSLYVEAMVLADDARSYFDDGNRDERDSLSTMARVTFSCESLKVTTRLMHVIAWLLTQRAVFAGELRAADALDHSRRLGEAPVTNEEVALELPERARRLVHASADLHRRVARLDEAQKAVVSDESPARQMFQRLALSF
ncbi:DUF1465 family protein [Sphingomonas sp. OV641]|uniref:DUF1465 family protein n=1 Tax=Sphingomonas sp. OV641 TaxID=1881068 RepID=UPI0035280104